MPELPPHDARPRGTFKQIIEGPEPGAPLEEWEAFLEEMLAEPDQDDEGVASSIRMARFMITLRKGELDETGNIPPPPSGR